MYLGKFSVSFLTHVPAGEHRTGSVRPSFEDRSERYKKWGHSTGMAYIPTFSHPDYEIQIKLSCIILYSWVDTSKFKEFKDMTRTFFQEILRFHNKYYKSSYMHFYYSPLPTAFMQLMISPSLFFKWSCREKKKKYQLSSICFKIQWSIEDWEMTWEKRRKKISLWSNDNIIYFKPGIGVYNLELLVGVILITW